VAFFDAMKHLDIPDIQTLVAEIQRVLKPGGIFFPSNSCRAAGSVDSNCENLHRSIQAVDWWVNAVQPEEATFTAVR